LHRQLPLSSFDLLLARDLLIGVPKPGAKYAYTGDSVVTRNLITLALIVQVVIPGATSQVRAQAKKTPYAAMAPLDQYLMRDEKSEIALARSAAPASISDEAEVMVLGRTGYRTAVKGTNGFLCIVERSWGAATDHPEFWNPKMRAPQADVFHSRRLGEKLGGQSARFAGSGGG
jgi:hypothetical protein